MEDAVSASATVSSASQKRITADVNQVRDAEHGIALRLNAMAQDASRPARDVVTDKRWASAQSLGFGLNGRTCVVLDYLHVDQDNIPDFGVPTVGLPGYTSPDRARPFITNAAAVDLRNVLRLEQRLRQGEGRHGDRATVRIERDFAPGFKLHNITRYGRTSQDYLLSAFMGSSAPWRRRTRTIRPPHPARSNRTVKDQENRILTNQSALTSEFATGSLHHTLVAGLELTIERQITYGLTGVATLPAANLNLPYAPAPATGLAPTRTGAYN